jgi:hypothetical protein
MLQNQFQNTVPFSSMPEGRHTVKANSISFKKLKMEDTDEYRRAQTIIDLFFYTKGDVACKDPAGLIRTLREQIESSVGSNNSIARAALVNHPKVIEIRDQLSRARKTQEAIIKRVETITQDPDSNGALLEEAFRSGDIDTIKFLVRQGVTEVTNIELRADAQDLEKLDNSQL